jgi:DNA-binding Lrp family transcriptional regulator
MNKIINICFSESAGGSFKHAISTKKLQGNQKVVVFFDDFSQGSIKGGVNIEERINWYNIFKGEDPLKPFVYYDIDELKENYNEFYDEISKMDSSDTLYLWYGSSREFCGMLYTLELLKDKNLNIHLINVKDTVIKRKEIQFQARDTGEIMLENIEKYAAAKRKLDSNEYRELLDRWELLKKDNSILRVLKDGKAKSVDENYFDIDILKYTPNEFRKSMRTLGEVLGKSEERISDEYIFWRIKELIKAGKIEYNGKLGVIGMEIKITEEGLKNLSTNKDAMRIWEEDRKASEEEEEIENKYRQQGRMEERIDMAKKLKDVLDDKTIANKTGLSVEQVKDLEEN